VRAHDLEVGHTYVVLVLTDCRSIATPTKIG
jgi:hypothetical protein